MTGNPGRRATDRPLDPAAPDMLWVVMPVYQDVAAFLELRPRILEGLDGRMPAGVGGVRFVVVDDTAGADPDIADLSELTDTWVVTPHFNLGHQRAIVFGLRVLAPHLAPRDYVVTMDSDGEDRAEDVPLLLEPLQDAPLTTVVLARRTQRTESLQFRVMYNAFRLLFRLLTGATVRTGNFAAQRGLALSGLIFHPSFDLCYSSTLVALRRPISYVPCPRGRRIAGRSRMNPYSLVAHGVRMLLPFAERLAVRALTLSAIFAVLTGLSAAVVAVLRATGNIATFPWMLVPITFLLLSVVIFSGFLALFSGFAQSSAIALQGVETAPFGTAGLPPGEVWQRGAGVRPDAPAAPGPGA